MISTDRLCPGCMNDNGGEKICPVCGYDVSSKNPQNCLAVGKLLKERYLVGQAKKQNGAETVYIGWDKSSDTAVRIKEYFPIGFGVRNADGSVSIMKGGEYIFNEGLMEFLDINRFIIGSALPSLMPIKDVFEENGTVYAVMPNIPSITLGEFLERNGGTLKWEQARPLFLPLIDTVKGMNDAGIIHGGISPETVLVGRDGKLRISEYSVSKLRYAGSELESKLYPGFAAAEQYGAGKLKTDTYTDVYGLCAVLFNALIGTVPPEAPLRIKNDSMTIPSKFAEELPRHVLSALANGLQVLPENRTQNIEDFKNELVYAETAESLQNERRVRESKARQENAKPVKKEKKGGTAKSVVISSAVTAAVFLIIAGIVFAVLKKDAFTKKKASSNVGVNASEDAPSVDSIGSIDSGAAVSDVLFAVPELTGKYYADLEGNEEYEKFQFSIKAHEYSDKYARGQICAQSVQAGTNVVRDTKIEVTISLGSKEIKIANLKGLDEMNAKLELLKQGFLYDNIEVLEKYDEDREPGTVLEQEPKYGTQVSPETAVKIYINSYSGSTDSSSSSSKRGN